MGKLRLSHLKVVAPRLVAELGGRDQHPSTDRAGAPQPPVGQVCRSATPAPHPNDPLGAWLRGVGSYRGPDRRRVALDRDAIAAPFLEFLNGLPYLGVAKNSDSSLAEAACRAEAFRQAQRAWYRGGSSIDLLNTMAECSSRRCPGTARCTRQASTPAHRARGCGRRGDGRDSAPRGSAVACRFPVTGTAG
jgi:hypothetical protein